MGEQTHISWADHTFNPWEGCMKVGPACDGCYAEHLVEHRFSRAVFGGPGKGVGTRRRTSAANWRKPLQWDRAAKAAGTRPFVFSASLADVFDNQVDPAWRRDLFDLIRATPHLTWLLLTKRPQNIVPLWAETLADDSGPPVALTSDFWPRNAAIGCTIATQAEAERDVPHLLRAKAALAPAFAFVSMEPLLGEVQLRRLSMGRGIQLDGLTGAYSAFTSFMGGFANAQEAIHAMPNVPARLPGLDWVITGGETDQGDHKARPTHPSWFKSLRDQCASAFVDFHHKQGGEWAPICWIAESGDYYHPAPRRDPEGHRRCKVETVVMDGDGTLRGPSDFGGYGPGQGSMLMMKIGKRASGRAIDGVTHDARPVVTP